MMRVIDTENRDILMEKAHNRTPQEYADLIWLERVKEHPSAKRARSKSWPVSCYDRQAKGYILETYKASNVTPIRKKKP